MNTKQNRSSSSGEMIKAHGLVYVDGKQEWADYAAFSPYLLPPDSLVLSDRAASALSAASMAIGELRKTASGIPAFLISGIARASMTKEAQLSSRIEGTIVPIENLLFPESEDSKTNPGDLQEVQNFYQAQTIAIAYIRDKRQLSQHLLKTTHERLLQGVRGEQWHPGEYRTLQNMIGSRRDINSARYVPPPAEIMAPLMDNLFDFIVSDDDVTELIRIGLAHYQFEAIHPFEDGNGRIGRLLIILMLISLGCMEQPLIYPSAYFDANQDEYRDRLLHVSTDGDWCGWLAFFLAGVREACDVAIKRCNRFTQVVEEAEEKVRQPRAPVMLFALIRLFANEFVMTVKKASAELKISDDTTRNYFKRLMKAGIIRKLEGRKRNVVYYINDVLQIMRD